MKLEKANTTPKLWCQLSATIDTFRYLQLSKNAQVAELKKHLGIIYFSVDSLNEASILCRKFIEYYCLGSSNWNGGRVVNNDFEFVAHVSYNGRIWDNEEYNKAKEILIK